MSYKKQVFKVSYIAIIGNIILAILKLLAGFIGHSQAMISDAFHSISDVLSSFVVMVGVFFAKKDADKKHPYGYERFESIASFILSFVLAFTGFFIGYEGIAGLFTTKDFQVPTMFPLIISIIAIVYKEFMYHYTKKIALKIKSNSLIAEAWHHRTDALASIGGFIGILGSMLGFPKLDVIASIIICLFILKVAYEIFLDSIQKIIDHACCDVVIKEIEDLILSVDGVLEIDSLKTRMFGNRIYCDVEIACSKKTNLERAHSIAHKVHDALEENISEIKHCMVHVNPK
ncbi:MAG: cation transporter [Firmicutes bacterium]|nr:cation transporter [Bacillota bacterium]